MPLVYQKVLSQELRIRRALTISVVEGSLHALMLGAAESYFGALAVELGHDPRALALLATVPLLMAAVSQLASSGLARRFGRKTIAVGGAVAQALSLAAIALVAHDEMRALTPLLLGKTAFYVAGGIMTPAWNAWITALTSGVSRSHYFGRRSAISQAWVFVAFLAAGYALKWTAADLHTFVVLVLVGLVARLASALALAMQADVEEPPDELASWSAWRRCTAAVRQGPLRVATYLALLMFGCTISTPFFTPYMLRELKMDYGAFALLSATSLLCKAIVFPIFHRLAMHHGLPRMLLVSGTGIAVVPVLWAMSSHYGWLFFVHVFSGAVWAGLEYSSFQLLMQDIRAELRTEFFSIANSMSGVLQVIGALIGGALLRSHWLSYAEIFVLSGVLRAIPLSVLLFQLPKLRLPGRLRRVPTRLMTVRPSAGALQRPILPAIENEPPAPTRVPSQFPRA